VKKIKISFTMEINKNEMCTKNKKRCKGFTLKYKRNAKDIFYNGDKI